MVRRAHVADLKCPCLDVVPVQSEEGLPVEEEGAGCTVKGACSEVGVNTHTHPLEAHIRITRTHTHTCTHAHMHTRTYCIRHMSDPPTVMMDSLSGMMLYTTILPPPHRATKS